jgi:hypothetical protein
VPVASELLSGPRGRRLCREIAHRVHSGLDLDESSVIDAVAAAVDSAMYWQPPDDMDESLSRPGATDDLIPVAEILSSATVTSWWSDRADQDRQSGVTWEKRVAPQLTGIRERLVDWRTRAVEGEKQAESRPRDPRARYSGVWWSHPGSADCPTTSRPRPALGAMQLMLTEDSMGWERAWVWPLRTREPANVYEVTGPDAWVDLVRRYPLGVTASRRHDWYRTTGIDSEWSIPDWAAVARDYHGVHLTMWGYLTTAGRALSVGDGATVLAGWNPDVTCWLGDVLESAGDPVEWSRRTGADEAPWTPASAG